MMDYREFRAMNTDIVLAAKGPTTEVARGFDRAQAATAEVYAKVLLIAGSREATQLGARRSAITFIAVDSAGHLWGSAHSKEILNVHPQYA